jgi:hypothetical protein
MPLAFGPSVQGGIDNLHPNGSGIVAIHKTGSGFMALFVELQRCGKVLDGVIGFVQYRDDGYFLPS